MRENTGMKDVCSGQLSVRLHYCMMIHTAQYVSRSLQRIENPLRRRKSAPFFLCPFDGAFYAVPILLILVLRSTSYISTAKRVHVAGSSSKTYTPTASHDFGARGDCALVPNPNAENRSVMKHDERLGVLGCVLG